jgi:hypothetical protein
MRDRLRAKLGLEQSDPHGTSVGRRSGKPVASHRPHHPLQGSALLQQQQQQRDATSALLRHMSVSARKAKPQRPWNTSPLVQMRSRGGMVGPAALAHSDMADIDSVALQYVRGRQKSLQELLAQHAEIGLGAPSFL